MPQLSRSSKQHATGWKRRGGLLVTVVAAFLVVASVASSASAAAVITDNFEDGDAAGWTTTGGTWIVNSYIADSRVLRQSSLAVNAQARRGPISWQDYTVEATVTPDNFNGLPGFAGITARAQSTTVYYALVLRPNDTAALIRTIGGVPITLADVDVEVTADTSYQLSLRVVDQTLTGSVDGVELSARDGFILGGQAGLITSYTSAYFDDVVVTTE